MTGRLEHDLRIKVFNESKLKTMPTYVSEYYQVLKASRRTETTCKDYLTKIYNFLAYINEDVKNVKADQIDSNIVTYYLSSIDTKINSNGDITYTSDSYKQTVWICLNGFMKFLVSRDYIKRNYVSDISKPKLNDQDRVNRKRVLLTDEEFNKILSQIEFNKRTNDKRRDKAMMCLMMCTGIRESALSEINLEDLDLENNRINGVSKGKKETYYVFNEVTKEAIINWLSIRNRYIKHKNINSLFISGQGNRMAVNSIANMVKKYTKEALGKPLSPHKIRAGYCSIICQKTGNIEFARRAMGHASVNTTKLYYVTDGKEKEEAANLIDIG